MLTCCNQCKRVKPVDHFYKSQPAKCKDCVKSNVKANRRKNIEHYKAFDKARANRPDRVAARKAYAKTAAGREAAGRAKANWAQTNEIKKTASNRVNNAVRDGKIEKPSACSECGKSNTRIEGHHDDYAKPLDVRWLCSACHRAWHKENGEGLNAKTEQAA